ncbi:MAG: transglutaminase domain-containing protein [Solirubrobacteraceae bacterium]|nr:transglutaminase domain-containing protein [Solirubrobacteraceae bacterium]
MTAATAPAFVRRPARTGPLLPPLFARLAGFAGLGLFGALWWGTLVDPPRGWALALFVFVAAGAGVLLATAPVRGRLGRALLATALLVLLLGGALLVAGVPLRFLAPTHWDALADGLRRGLEASASVRVPYGGSDPWVRSVLVLGAPVLLSLGAILAFWPRPGGEVGYRIASAVALGAVAAVPAVQREVGSPVGTGVVLAVLVLVYLSLDRVPRRAAPVAAGLVGVAALAGVVAAPALDPQTPLIDYEGIAQDLAPQAGQRFFWDHRYGPMDWPRDGTEVLRVRASRGSYWKAEALSEFDGVRWRRDRGSEDLALDTEIARDRSDWRTRLRVTVGEMTSEEFIGAGTVLSIDKSPRQPVQSAPGEFRVDDRPLRRGNTYEVEAYVPRPTAREMAAATTAYPSYVSDDLIVNVPQRAPGRPVTEVQFASFGAPTATLATVDGQVVVGDDAEEAVRQSAYARTYGLAQRLRAGAATPYEYVRAVQRHLRSGYSYDESPPIRSAPLDAFLFDDRIGYCQQFSGAMALLLRMGGVPARVATGFSPGAFDDTDREYVVRDLDAHSWVEVYIPAAGWVAFDPTPSGTPARSRALGTRAGEPRTGSTDPGPQTGRGLELPSGGGAAPESEPDGGGLPTGLLLTLAGIVAICGTGFAAFGVRRRSARRRAPVQVAMGDLDRAMRRVGRPLPPQTTLTSVADRLSGTSAEAYVRTLARARYGPPGPATRAPSGEERAGLRRVLARRGGPVGWVRAWWALPPF